MRPITSDHVHISNTFYHVINTENIVLFGQWLALNLIPDNDNLLETFQIYSTLHIPTQVDYIDIISTLHTFDFNIDYYYWSYMYIDRNAYQLSRK